MSEEIKQAVEEVVQALSTGSLHRLYQAELHLHALLSHAVGADLAREAYEEYNSGD